MNPPRLEFRVCVPAEGPGIAEYAFVAIDYSMRRVYGDHGAVHLTGYLLELPFHVPREVARDIVRYIAEHIRYSVCFEHTFGCNTCWTHGCKCDDPDSQVYEIRLVPRFCERAEHMPPWA